MNPKERATAAAVVNALDEKVLLWTRMRSNLSLNVVSLVTPRSSSSFGAGR